MCRFLITDQSNYENVASKKKLAIGSLQIIASHFFLALHRPTEHSCVSCCHKLKRESQLSSAALAAFEPRPALGSLEALSRVA